MNYHKKHLEGDWKEPDELICYGSQRSLFLRKENLDIHFQNKYLNTNTAPVLLQDILSPAGTNLMVL